MIGRVEAVLSLRSLALRFCITRQNGSFRPRDLGLCLARLVNCFSTMQPLCRYTTRTFQSRRAGMDVSDTVIADVKRVKPRRFGDSRGWFEETWNMRRMAEAGLDIAFVQDNQSFSAERGTIRGLHFQRPPHAQGKLVRCLRGTILDVAVDIRRGSPTYGHWITETLSAENGMQLWVPRGFLHGFVTLEPETVVAYKVDGFYAADCEGAVRFDDADLGIDWGIKPELAVVSDKDAAAPDFRGFDSPFTWEGAA